MNKTKIEYGDHLGISGVVFIVTSTGKNGFSMMPSKATGCLKKSLAGCAVEVVKFKRRSPI